MIWSCFFMIFCYVSGSATPTNIPVDRVNATNASKTLVKCQEWNISMFVTRPGARDGFHCEFEQCVFCESC